MKDDALFACSGSSGTDKQCARDILARAKGKTYTVSADCSAKTLTTAQGKTFKYNGVKFRPDVDGTDHIHPTMQIWVDTASGHIAGDGADNYPMRDGFEKLCPEANESIKANEATYRKVWADSHKPPADFELVRVFKSSEDFYRLVFTVRQPVTVKCVMYDKSQKPLTVETFTLTPPAEETVMRYIGASAEVWRFVCK